MTCSGALYKLWLVKYYIKLLLISNVFCSRIALRLIGVSVDSSNILFACVRGRYRSIVSILSYNDGNDQMQFVRLKVKLP